MTIHDVLDHALGPISGSSDHRHECLVRRLNGYGKGMPFDEVGADSDEGSGRFKTEPSVREANCHHNTSVVWNVGIRLGHNLDDEPDMEDTSASQNSHPEGLEGGKMAKLISVNSK